eukprot:11219836-Lingulodinium_polyedra.AAC.1
MPATPGWKHRSPHTRCTPQGRARGPCLYTFQLAQTNNGNNAPLALGRDNFDRQTTNGTRAYPW